MNEMPPSLYGLTKSNRDFTKKSAWGKNQFNSAFPAALCCYLASQNLPANYICMENEVSTVKNLEIKNALNIDPADDQAYFAFESQYTPYQRFVIGSLPRTDLVMQREKTGECRSGLEVKLTALPDNTTCDMSENHYGCEIVVRPDSIVYLACSIATALQEKLHEILPRIDDVNWTQPSQVVSVIPKIIGILKSIAIHLGPNQTAFLLQPIWKTLGKSPMLADQCFDVFIWSNASFTSFIANIANPGETIVRINRQTRTAIWLYKMLADIRDKGKFDHKLIIDTMTYNSKNDKAFASAGNITRKYMQCARMTKPILAKEVIRNIILGGGQHLLSPERRLDAILCNTPGLFS